MQNTDLGRFPYLGPDDLPFVGFVFLDRIQQGLSLRQTAGGQPKDHQHGTQSERRMIAVRTGEGDCTSSSANSA